VIGYGAAFYLLSLSLKQIPLGVAYAIGSGLGTVGVLLIGRFLWGEALNALRGVRDRADPGDSQLVHSERVIHIKGE